MDFYFPTAHITHMKKSLFLSLITASALSAHGTEVWNDLSYLIPELNTETTTIQRITYTSGGTLSQTGDLPQTPYRLLLELWMRDGIPAIGLAIPVQLPP